MSNVVKFGRASRPDPVASMRADIEELFEVIESLTFATIGDRNTFTDPDFVGTGINALAARIQKTATGEERQGYMAMAAGAYLASQRMFKVVFWLDDLESWQADKDPALAFRLADENFIIYAEQALAKNARMHPDCTQYIYRALAASQTLVQKARAHQASLNLPLPPVQPEIGPLSP